MRRRFLLVPFLVLFFTSGNSVFSQIRNIGFDTKLSYSDSLAGFDEEMFRQIALQEGTYGEVYKRYLDSQKRVFIDLKYNLKKYSETPIDPSSIDYSNYPRYQANIAGKGIGGSNSINSAPCVNEGFELGNFSGWIAGRGSNLGSSFSCSYIATPSAVAFPSSSLQVMTTPFPDAIVGTVTASPFLGSKVLKINDEINNFDGAMVRISQTFPVTNSNFLYEFAYRAIMGSNHTCCDQPYMRVSLRDFVGNLLSCPLFTFAPPPTSGPICSSPGITWSLSAGGFYYNPTWQKYSIDLTSYINSTVTIEVTVSDCSQTGHFGYAYFDSNCGQLGVTLNNTVTIPAPTSTVNVAGQCAQIATLTAPGGLGPYTWNGPPLSGVTNNTNQTISAPIAGDYTLTMLPPGTCLPIVRVVKMSFPPPTTITASPSATICNSGTNTVTTLSAVGAAQYTWQPGGSNLNIVNFSPTVTTIYTLTARTGTCVGDYTFQVTVAPNPNLVVLSSNVSLCPGQTATLSASGANTYSWLPVGFTGSQVAITQTATTTYTTIGTSTAGCVSTATTAIVQTTLAPASVIQIGGPTGTICPGTPLTFVGLGATSFTWMPPGALTNPVVLTPTVTTTFTAIGSTGSCTNSAMFTVTVDPGPTMTVTSSPTIICPGNSATLSTFAPASLGFTWSPVASNATSIVVTPTTATIYSVSGIDALGCISTYTVAPIISPVPNLTISPSTPSVCFGGSIALTASGGSTYTWNPGNLVASSIVVSLAANTTFTIIGSNGTCTSSTTSSVSVVPLPPVTATTSAASICSGQSTTLSGTGATSYTWQPGNLFGTSVIVSPTVNTTYTVTGKLGACDNTATVAITVNYGPTLNPVATPTAICPGGVSVLNASGAVSYTWNPGALSGSSPTVSPAATTVYTVTGVTALGCSSTSTVSLTVNPNPTITPSASSPSICAGSSTTLSAIGGITYTWNPGALPGTPVTVSPASSTTYTVGGTNGFGCTTQNTISILVVPIPVVTSTANPSSICLGTNANLSAGGATNYTWTPGGLTGSLVVVSPTINTTYTVSGNTAGCAGTSTVLLTVLNGPTLNPVASPTAICPGGSSNLSASGATGYTWNPGGTTGANISVSPTITTTYSVTGSNAIGCLTTNTLQVVVNPVPNVTLTSSTPSICAGSNATLVATGAASYVWNPGALAGATIVVSPPSNTTYTVTGTNGFGCTGQNTISLIVVPIPVITPSAIPASICLGTSGTLSAGGATGYTWNPGNLSGASVVVSPTLTTTYSVLGSALGCSSTSTVLLTVLNGPTLNPVASPTAICPGGSSNLSASGASGYTWNPGGTTGANISVSPTITTTYSVTGSNAIGCLTTNSLQVVVNPVPSLTLSASTPSICLGSSATLTAIGAGTYTWNPGALAGGTVVVSPPSNTTYTVSGTNAFGCIGTNTISLLVVPLPTVSASSSPTPPAICAGASATLTGNGATSYTWFPGAVANQTLSVSPLSTSFYTVFGTSAACTSSAIISVTVNAVPVLTIAATPATLCVGFSSTLNASGAATYTWNPGNIVAANTTVAPVTNTTYTVTGASAFGCVSTRTLAVTVNPIPTLSLSATSATICSGNSTSLTAAGASTYTWNPGNVIGTTISVSPLSNTTYTANGTSALGCIGQNTILITVNPTPTLNASSSATAVCVGNCATLTAGGAGSYTWVPGGTGTSIAVCPTITTTYTLQGVSGTCSSSTVISINVNPLPSLTITASSSSLCSGSSATLSGSGANTYTWLPSGTVATSISVSPAVTSSYTLNGSSAAGCTNSVTTTINVSPTPTVGVTSTTNNICNGGSVTLTPSGAGNYTLLPGGTSGLSFVVSPSVTTTYTVNGASGACSSFTTILITVNPLPTITAVANPSTVCFGFSTTLTANGAATYTWLPSGLTGSLISTTPTLSTTYTINAQSAFGCFGSNTLSVSVITAPVINIAASPTAVCIGGSATLTGIGAASFTWQPGNVVSSSLVVTPTTTSNYTLFGDNGGCIGTASTQLVVNPLPTVTAVASSTALCSGSSLTLTANGASSYTWLPIAQNGSLVTLNPTVTTTYSVAGSDANGCMNAASVNVLVNPNPTLTAVASASAICENATVTLTANGAINYTWTPSGLNTAIITDAPLLTTTYTVNGTDANGCSGSETVQVTVFPNPTISISPVNSTICVGSTVTLTANGAINYTWLPGGSTATSIVESPTLTTTYTLSGDNGGICSSNFTAQITVNPLPANVTASTNGSITCASPTVDLFGASTSTNVTYNWSGPFSYTSAAQNPTAVAVWGAFTLTVSDIATGCSSTATVNVLTDYSIPSVTTTASSSSITCAIPVVTITAANTTTNAGYVWSGPSGFTNTSISFTTNLSGIYSVTVTDLSSSCFSSGTISINTFTNVVVTASIVPATCNGTVSNNNGTIIVFNFGAADKYSYVTGSTYTGTATYTNATPIPTSGIVTSTLANPSGTVAYTLRIFDAKGCIKDTTLILQPTNCANNSLGLAKSIPSIITNDDGTYDVTVKTVVKNYGSAVLTEISLDENLSNVFPPPMSFTIVTPPALTSSGSSLVVNSGFDGSAQTSLTSTLSSIPGGRTDTLIFTVKVNSKGYFGPFSNSIKGNATTLAVPPVAIVIADSSNTGLNPDPDSDGNPANNNMPTIFNFTPKLFFGLTKKGEAIKSDNNSFDFKYSIKVHNLGNDTLYNVTIKDSLFEKAVKSPASYTIKTPVSTSGNLAPNPSFDGKTNVNLTLPAQSKLPPGVVSTIDFVINVVTDSVTVYKNSAFGRAINSKGTTVTDTSGNGDNPDINNNGVWNEPADNLPTVLVISNYTLFIPQGFTPNGDGTNETFVIKGLSSDNENEITIFNRWGNKVYHNSNYDNTWDGRANMGVGTGNNKLPQGTYYYILDIKGSGQKPYTGFIVLQY